MSSRSGSVTLPSALLLGVAALAACVSKRAEPDVAAAVLNVCADPNNLPFSSSDTTGFENRIAVLLARELHTGVRFTWWAQRRGFLRNTINAGACDVWMGVPSGLGNLTTTQPYYRSTYVFVTRAADHLRIASLDDPVLRRVKVGVQLIGDDGANTPPAHALTRRNIVANVRGYHVEADYRQPNPPSRILEALARGDIDVAVVWGPLGGYFASRESVPLHVEPVHPQVDIPFLPFVFDIAIGVRHGDSVLASRLDSAVARRRPEIDRILAAYAVPRVDAPTVQ